jgi:RHS repeat-associated protein
VKITTFVYDPEGQLAQEVTTAAVTETGTRYLTPDPLGSVRLETDSLGGVTKCLDYAPFGESLAGNYGRTATCFTSTANVPQFTGQYRDQETQIDFFEARFYASAQGRFLSPDAPLADQDPGDPQSWNLYAYGRNNPLSNVDPTGKFVVNVGPNCYVNRTEGRVNGELAFTEDSEQWCLPQNVTKLELPSLPPTTSRIEPLRPLPPVKPQPPFSACMENHASDFSLAGIVDAGFAIAGQTQTQPGHSFLGSTLGGNDITGAYFAIAGNSAQSISNAKTTAVGQGIAGRAGVIAGMGTNLTAGARTSSIMSLNLAGKPGPGAQVLARSSSLRGFLGKVGKAGLVTELIAAGLTAAEAIDCAKHTEKHTGAHRGRPDPYLAELLRKSVKFWHYVGVCRDERG